MICYFVNSFRRESEKQQFIPEDDTCIHLFSFFFYFVPFLFLTQLSELNVWRPSIYLNRTSFSYTQFATVSH